MTHYHAYSGYGFGAANGDSPATTQEIKAEAAEMTPAQRIKAAEEIVAASADIAKTAGPLVGMALQTFGQVAAGAGQLFTPALQGLLALPLPPPVKETIKGIIQSAKQQAPGPKPKTPPAKKTKITEKLEAERKMPWPWIIGGGVAGLGLIAFLATRKKRR